MKILRANFVAHCMMNCLDNAYVPLNPAEYGWQWNSSSSMWEPIWYEGDALPNDLEIQNAEEQGEEEEESPSDEENDAVDRDLHDDDEEEDDESDCVSSEDESSEDEDDN